MFTRKTSSLLAASIIGLYSANSSAYNLVNTDGYSLSFDAVAAFAAFNSSESYTQNPGDDRKAWIESSINYGLSGSYNLSEDQQFFGKTNLVTSGNWGDGDASGLITGEERDTGVEELYIGYKNQTFSISVGRQVIRIGDGFIVNDDALNMGKGIDPELERSGAYYLAPHKALDKSVLVSIGQEEGFRSDLFWFKSDNKAQGRPTMAGINIEHQSQAGTFGLLHLKGLDVDPSGILGGAFDYPNRDGQETTSVRYQGNANQDNLFLSAEFAHQEQGNSQPSANAWYAEAGWNFSDLNWSPTLKYRYSSFDNGYDQLFTGFNAERDYGTWFQGEVWGNYASGGTFNSDVDITMLGVTAMPREDLAIGALYYDFSNTRDGNGGNDAQEINLFATWFPAENLIISPLVGFYTPESDTSTQGNTDTNIYSQVQAIVMF